MNDLLQLMLNRRSIRRYTGEPVPEDKLKLILQAGLASATSKNRKPWEFVVVQQKGSSLGRIVKAALYE